MNATVAQWIGCRDHQEDAYAVKHFPTGTLAVVCDGMGGHCCGDIAARTAADTFVETFSGNATLGGVPARLSDALKKANEAVGRIFDENGLYGGCTLSAVYAAGALLWWVSVGDSPLLLWRGKHLSRLNADHSMRAIYREFARDGAISFQEAMSQGHMLRSAVTGDEIALVDLSSRAQMLLPGDRVVLATDGVENLLLSPILSDNARHALSTPLVHAAAAIVEACRALGDAMADNTTVIALDV